MSSSNANARSAARGSDSPLVVHGSTASYYTGKLEAYLRAKGIPYVLEPFSPAGMRRCAAHTGIVQIPQVECPDGSWLVDTTLIIEYFERTRPEPRITPPVPAVAFVSQLIEDYGDEWLWRPAMHYRWSFPETARLMSAHLAEHLTGVPVPQLLKRWWWRRRQRRIFVRGDGVTAKTRPAVEAVYLETLSALEAVFLRRPFVLGLRPTEADFGLFASMFRHFSCDPAPARIMRERAPAVYERVARMWNLRPECFGSEPFPERIPGDLGDLLAAIARDYLPYLDANASAYARGQQRVHYQAAGAVFVEPVKPYRVWCRDRLHRQFSALDPAARAEVREAMGGGDAVDRLLVPSPKPAPDLIGSLPLPGAPGKGAVADSWWRK